MSNLTQTTGSGYTLRDLVLRVAEYLNIAQYPTRDDPADVPLNEHDLDLCKRIVNDGLMDFYIRYPRWSFFKHTIELTFDPTGKSDRTVNGDPSRYWMPHWFSGIVYQDLYYDQDGPRTNVVQVNAARIMQLSSSVSRAQGDPYFFAVRPLDYETSRQYGGSKYELIFYPEPEQDFTVRGVARRMPYQLKDLDERPIHNAEHDIAALAAVIAYARKHSEGVPADNDPDYMRLLQHAIRMDQETENVSVGLMHDPRDILRMGTYEWDRIGPGVISYNGLDITGA